MFPRAAGNPPPLSDYASTGGGADSTVPYSDEAKFSRPVGFFRSIFAPIVIPRVNRVKVRWGRRGGQENFEFFMGFWSKIGLPSKG